MTMRLTISAASKEQAEAMTEAVRAALTDFGATLSEPDPAGAGRKRMFPMGEVVQYAVQTAEAVGATVVAIGAGVVSNAIYARLKILHPRDEIDRDGTASGFEVVNQTTGARAEIDDEADGQP